MLEKLLIQWAKMKIIKAIKNKIAKSKILKGKLTYSGIALIVAAVAAPFLGVDADVIKPEILEVAEGVGAAIALVGRYRTTATDAT